MLDGLCRDLPGAEFALVSVASRLDGAVCPVRLGPHLRESSAAATAARTTRFCRTRRRRSSCATRELTGFGPPCPHLSRRRRPRPPHPGPRFVTTYDRPSSRTGTTHKCDKAEFLQIGIFSHTDLDGVICPTRPSQIRRSVYHFSFDVRTSSSNDQARSGWR